jgi:carboxyl-terminal processing protease
LRRAITGVLIGIVGLIAGIFLGANSSWMPEPVRSALIEPIAGENSVVTEQAADLIESRYFREPDLARLDDASIRGMVEELRERYRDRFTHYFDPKQAAAFDEVLSGTFSGVGMTVGDLRAEGLSVGLVFRGSPADRAGLEPGDVIVSVDGEAIGGDPVDSVVSRIKGPEGTEVELGIRIQGRGRKKDFTLSREEIRVPVAAGRVVSRDDLELGHIRFSSFSEGSGFALRRALRRVVDEGADGIVLDLRGNGGGLLPEAIIATSNFVVRDELVVETRSRTEGEMQYRTVGGRLDLPPVVVLMDRSTASAAEILAAALRFYLDAPLVGIRSFGKGLFQQVIPLTNGGSLDLSVGEFVTASGQSLAGGGLDPDVVVRDSRAEGSDRQLQRAFAVLAGRIEQ